MLTVGDKVTHPLFEGETLTVMTEPQLCLSPNCDEWEVFVCNANDSGIWVHVDNLSVVK